MASSKALRTSEFTVSRLFGQLVCLCGTDASVPKGHQSGKYHIMDCAITALVGILSHEVKVDAPEGMNEGELAEIERFCEEEGLPRTEWIPGDVLRVFTVRSQDSRLEATAKLERHGERFFIEDLVVRVDLRGRGHGRGVVSAVLQEAKTMGADSLWAMARAVHFFEGLGFAESDDEVLRTEILTYCRQCVDYGSKCHPKLLRLGLP